MSVSGISWQPAPVDSLHLDSLVHSRDNHSQDKTNTSLAVSNRHRQHSPDQTDEYRLLSQISQSDTGSTVRRVRHWLLSQKSQTSSATHQMICQMSSATHQMICQASSATHQMICQPGMHLLSLSPSEPCILAWLFCSSTGGWILWWSFVLVMGN